MSVKTKCNLFLYYILGEYPEPFSVTNAKYRGNQKALTSQSTV